MEKEQLYRRVWVLEGKESEKDSKYPQPGDPVTYVYFVSVCGREHYTKFFTGRSVSSPDYFDPLVEIDPRDERLKKIKTFSTRREANIFRSEERISPYSWKVRPVFIPVNSKL